MSEYGRKDWSEVSANPIVDWGKLTTDFTEKLTAQEKVRSDYRQKIADDTSKALNDVQTYSVGNNQNVNTALFDASNAATSLLKAQYDLVKKGQADPRQFQMVLKTTQDSFSNMKKVGDTWSQRSATLEDRTNKGINSKAEINYAKLDAGLEQFNNLKIIPDSNGVMYAYRTKDDGSIDTKYPPVAPNILLNPANTMVDKVFVANETAPIAKTVQDYITKTGSRSLGEFTNNPMGKKSWDDFSNGAANTITATPNRTMSVLVDGMGYDMVFTEEDHKANPNAVYVKTVNGIRTPQITDAQKKAAQDHVKETLASQVEYKQIQQYQPQRPVAAPKEDKGDKDDRGYALNYGLYVDLVKGGTAGNDAQTAINNSLPEDTKILKIEGTGNKKIFTIRTPKGNTTKEVSLVDANGKSKDAADIAEQIYGLTNSTNVIRRDKDAYLRLHGYAGDVSTKKETNRNYSPVNILSATDSTGNTTIAKALSDNNEAENQVDIYGHALESSGLDPNSYKISSTTNYFGKDYVVFKDKQGKFIGKIEEDDPEATKQTKLTTIMNALNKSTGKSAASKKTQQNVSKGGIKFTVED
jgi:hypothetical protein